MPDDKTIKQPIDKQTFYINDPSEVRNRFKSLECTKDQLKVVVATIDKFADTIKAFF